MRRLLLALLLLVPLLACGGDDTDPLAEDVGGSAVDDAERGEDDDVDPGSGTVVTLLDPGDEPRRELRLSPPEDCEQQVTNRQVLRQEVSISGQSQETNQESTFDLTYRCTEVTDDRIEVTSTYGSITTESDFDSPELQQMMDQLEGAQARLVLDRRGGILEAETPRLDLDGDLGKALDPLLESLDDIGRQSSTPLPEEPVGIGAVWRVTGTIDSAGILMHAVSEYTVTELTDDVVTASVDLTMTADGSDAAIPGVPHGADFDLLEGTFRGSGTARWHLDSVIPIQSLVSQGTMRMRMKVEGEQLVMELRQRQETTTSPS